MAGEDCWERGKRDVKVARDIIVGRGAGERRKVERIVCSVGGIV